MSKMTPGPWVAKTKTGRASTTVYSGVAGTAVVAVGCKAPDARVIAAVPEMRSALLGAVELLSRIAGGEALRAVEVETRLARYKEALLKGSPEFANDPYYGRFFAR